MAPRTRAGVPGIETPRMKDQPDDDPELVPELGESGSERAEGPGKRARRATTRALDDFLRAHGATEDERKRWMTEYRAFCTGLPSQSASVRALVADRIRNGYLSEYYSLLAKTAKSETARAKYASSAHGCDMHVQRFALHARDLAFREAGIEKRLDELGARVDRLAPPSPADARRVMSELFGSVGPTEADDVPDAIGAAPEPVPEPGEHIAGAEALENVVPLHEPLRVRVAEAEGGRPKVEVLPPLTRTERRLEKIQAEAEKGKDQWARYLAKGDRDPNWRR